MSAAARFPWSVPLALGAAAASLGAAERLAWAGIVPGLFALTLWLAAGATLAPLWRRVSGSRLASLGLVLAQAALAFHVARLAWAAWSFPALGAAPAAADPRVHLVGLSLLFGLFFLLHWLDDDARRESAPPVRLLIGALALQSLVGLLALLSSGWPLAVWAARLFVALTLLLVIEWAFALALRAFQAPSLRRATPFTGRSLLLDALLGGRSPFATVASALSDNLGLEIRGTWVARALRFAGEPLLLLLLGGLWLASAVVVVPLGHEGVRSTWGRFASETLAPGLHFIAPWPAGGVRLVPVGRVEAFALGFETDLGGPLLWTEKHFEGEQNLLVGNGEEALNFNVPIQFSRADALAAERIGPALPGLLSQLARRELLRATALRDGFAIMTGERDVIAAEVARGLQNASDRLALGARIHHVGLKDIHPPVEVAPAYHEVGSASEQSRMMVDLARANRITRLAESRGDAGRLRAQAEGAAANRLGLVAGEAARLAGKVEARAASPELFDWQSRLALAEEIVPRSRLFITRAGAAGTAPLNLDYRDAGAGLP